MFQLTPTQAIEHPDANALPGAVVPRHMLLRDLLQLAMGSSVVMIDDAQWCDAKSWRVLDALLTGGACRMMVVAARPFEVRGHARSLLLGSSCFSSELAHLTQSQITQLACRRIGVDALPRQLEQLLHRRAQGNPLFCVLLVKHLVDQGHISTGPDLSASVAKGGTAAAATGLKRHLGLVGGIAGHADGHDAATKRTGRDATCPQAALPSPTKLPLQPLANDGQDDGQVSVRATRNSLPNLSPLSTVSSTGSSDVRLTDVRRRPPVPRQLPRLQAGGLPAKVAYGRSSMADLSPVSESAGSSAEIRLCRVVSLGALSRMTLPEAVRELLLHNFDRLTRGRNTQRRERKDSPAKADLVFTGSGFALNAVSVRRCSACAKMWCNRGHVVPNEGP